MPYKKNNKWYNGYGELIMNPDAYFKACGENEYERYMETLIPDFEADQVAVVERNWELENAGFSSEEEYADAYYSGENSDLGEPLVWNPWHEDYEDDDQWGN
tara:strand:- start:481 stop:786 length:306 start_codon:yes stop_codon:yes gene_type:complete